MLRYLLRKQGIRDLSLPAAVLPVLAANVPRYQVLSRSRVGPRYLEWWGERSRRQILQRYFGDAADDIGISPPAAALVNGEGQPRRTASGARL